MATPISYMGQILPSSERLACARTQLRVLSRASATSRQATKLAPGSMNARVGLAQAMPPTSTVASLRSILASTPRSAAQQDGAGTIQILQASSAMEHQ